MPEAYKEQARTWIQEAVTRGLSYKDIESQMLNSGWDPLTIEELYRDIMHQTEPTIPPQAATTPIESTQLTSTGNSLLKGSISKVLKRVIIGIVGLVVLSVVASVYFVNTTAFTLDAYFSELQTLSTQYSNEHQGDYTGICEWDPLEDILKKIDRPAEEVLCEASARNLKLDFLFEKELHTCSSLVNKDTGKEHSLACIVVPLVSDQSQAVLDKKEIVTLNEAALEIQPTVETFASGATLKRIDMPNYVRTEPSYRSESNEIASVGMYGGKLGFTAGDLSTVFVLDGEMSECLQEMPDARNITAYPYKDSTLLRIDRLDGYQLYEACKRIGSEYESVQQPFIFDERLGFVTGTAGNNLQSLWYQGKEYGKGSRFIKHVTEHNEMPAYVSSEHLKMASFDALHEVKETIFVGETPQFSITYGEGEVVTVFSSGGKLGYVIEERETHMLRVMFDGKEVLQLPGPGWTGVRLQNGKGYIGLGDTGLYFNDGAYKTLPGTDKITISEQGKIAYIKKSVTYLNDVPVVLPPEFGKPHQVHFVGERLLVGDLDGKFLFDDTLYDFGTDSIHVMVFPLDGKVLFQKTSQDSAGKITISLYYEADAPWESDLIRNVNFVKQYNDVNWE